MINVTVSINLTFLLIHKKNVLDDMKWKEKLHHKLVSIFVRFTQIEMF